MKGLIVGEKALYIPKYYFVYCGKIYEKAASGCLRAIDKTKNNKKEKTNAKH